MSKKKDKMGLVVVMEMDKVMPEEIEAVGRKSVGYEDVMDSVAYWNREDRDGHVMDLLQEAHRCWDNMDEWRQKRDMSKNFVYTNQYCEYVRWMARR